MTPGARLSAAITVLDDMANGSPAEVALTRWGRGARYAGSGDRAAVRDVVYAVLRRRESCAVMGAGSVPRALVLGHARLENLALETLFTGQGHDPAELSPQERSQEPSIPDPITDIPEWLRAALAQRSDQPEALFEAMAHRAPLWLRVNLRRATRAAVIEALAADGIVSQPHPECATALEVTQNPRRLRNSPVYLDGLVEPQDLSVQLAISALPWPDDGAILDYCAGGGGKALALADCTGARITAHDALPQRMVDLGPRAARAGVQIAQATTDDLAQLAPFDAVLCDVPCSGSGTWRRDPEAKWSLTPARLEALVATQDHILDQATPLVRCGGTLVYMTCSLLAAENEERVAAFLDRNPGWQSGEMHVFTPVSASDGFFAARLLAPDAVAGSVDRN